MIPPAQTEAERVAIGARFMDTILPQWYQHIDLDTLDMSSGSLCLLGQTFGVHAERCVAREMYPKEFRASETSEDKIWGWCRAINNKGNMLGRIMTTRNLTDQASIEARTILERVCQGHDNKCEWANEIATRLANDTEEGV